MAPRISEQKGTELFLFMRGYMCSRCSPSVRNKCHRDLTLPDQVDMIQHCICTLKTMGCNDENFPEKLPDLKGE